MKLADQVKELRRLLLDWSNTVAKEIGTAGVYLFGSLVYRDGAQFVSESDVDLVILFPDEVKGAIARGEWLGKLLIHKRSLENMIVKLLGRAQHGEQVCSVVVPTKREIGADIHKDGAEGFFGNNRFVNLLDGKLYDKFPHAGEEPLMDRLARQCLRYAQKQRNTYLAVSADGTEAMESFEGGDPIPKSVMRHAAMAAQLRNPKPEIGAEYDTQAGLDFLTNFLYDVRANNKAYSDLHHWVSVRRGARGKVGPLPASDIVFMSEILWDLVAETIDARKAQEIDVNEKREEQIPGGHSTVFFSRRFAQAFPGVRGVEWFDDSGQIKMRLLRLLEEPLTFAKQKPVWWWRGGNLPLEHFSYLNEHLFLMDGEELNIRRIAAVNAGAYYQSFVYIETNAMPPTGLYDSSKEVIDSGLAMFGYHSEEYGLLDDGRFVTRAQYDDGAALLDGALVDIRGKVELRTRYLTPYNTVVAAHESPINNKDFDRRLLQLLNEMVQGKDKFPELVRDVLKLPRREFAR